MTFYYSIANPFPQLLNLQGRGLNDGEIYIGVAGQDPVLNPINVYWASNGTDQASQPLDVQGGFVVRNGTPATAYIASNYSMKAFDSQGSLLYYLTNVLDPVFEINAALAALEAELLADTGAGIVGFDQEESYAAATVGRSLQGIVNIRNKPFNATGNGIADDTAEIQAAIDFVCARGGGTVFFPIGEYLVTDTLTIDTAGVELVGVSQKGSVIAFAPGSAKTCLDFTAGAGVLYNCGVKNIGIQGSGAFQKKGIVATDVSSFIARDIEIIDFTGNTSVGIQTKGREVSVFENIHIGADLPIQISANPNSNIDANEFVFRDLYLVAEDATQPCILGDDAIFFSGLKFLGKQSWVHGADGFRFVNTTGAEASFDLIFEGIWREQGDSATAYVLNIQGTAAGPVQGLTIIGGFGDTGTRGFKFLNVWVPTIVGYNYPGTGEALNVNGTVLGMTFQGFRAAATSTATLTDQRLMFASTRFASTAPFAEDAHYQSTASIGQSYSELWSSKIRTVLLTDGVTAPSAVVGFGEIFIDTADGDLKIMFGDGTVKTIVTDT